jgi:hypothetical protein
MWIGDIERERNYTSGTEDDTKHGKFRELYY